MPVIRLPALLALGATIATAATCLSFVPQPVHQVRAAARVNLPRVEIVARADEVRAAYFDSVRDKMHWVPAKVGREVLLAPDYESRLMLAKSAADRAGLNDVGLSWRDVYAIIDAETSWVPRTGASRNGTPNLGIAQFEPETAKALGLRDPNDPVEAVHVAALHIRQAALWSAERLHGMKLGKAQRAEKLREGVSVYYNLSTRGRNAWNGMNTAELPVETQRHISNARLGAQEAGLLDAQLKAKEFSRGREVMTAAGSDGRG